MARFYLQGDIEAVAAKSPAGLTLLFEQISGSVALKRPYEELENAKTKVRIGMLIIAVFGFLRKAHGTHTACSTWAISCAL